MATSLNNLGTARWQQGDPAGAEAYYRRALAIWEKVLGPEHPSTQRTRKALAHAAAMSNRGRS